MTLEYGTNPTNWYRIVSTIHSQPSKAGVIFNIYAAKRWKKI